MLQTLRLGKQHRRRGIRIDRFPGDAAQVEQPDHGRQWAVQFMRGVVYESQLLRSSGLNSIEHGIHG